MKTETLILLDDDQNVVAALAIESDQKQFQDFIESKKEKIGELVAEALRDDPFNLELKPEDIALEFNKNNYSITVDCGEQGEFTLVPVTVYK